MDAYFEDGGAVVADPNNSSVIWSGGAYNTGAIRIMSVSKSTNLGTSWQRYGLTAGVGYTYAIAVTPGNSNVIYAGGYEGSAASLYKTTNGGSLWFSSSTGITSDTMYSIAVHPVNNSIVLAGTRHGVFKSVNGAATWSNKGCSGVRSVLIDPADPTTVYAGTSFGVYKSMDTGETWTAMNAGLRDTCITSMGIYPGAFLFAGTREDGMYRSPLIPSTVDEAESKTRMTMSVYPNPAPGGTAISFYLPKAGPIACSIYDPQGRLVSTLVDQSLPAGPHNLRWSGLDDHNRPVTAGVYILNLRTGAETSARPLVIIR